MLWIRSCPNANTSGYIRMNPYIAWKAELEMACFVGIWINPNTDSEWQQPMISTNFSNYKKKWKMLSCKTYKRNFGFAELLTWSRPSSVLCIVTHLVGWAPLVVIAVIRLSSSSLFSLSFFTRLSIARLLKLSDSPPCNFDYLYFSKSLNLICAKQFNIRDVLHSK